MTEQVDFDTLAAKDDMQAALLDKVLAVLNEPPWTPTVTPVALRKVAVSYERLDELAGFIDRVQAMVRRESYSREVSYAVRHLALHVASTIRQMDALDVVVVPVDNDEEELLDG